MNLTLSTLFLLSRQYRPLMIRFTFSSFLNEERICWIFGITYFGFDVFLVNSLFFSCDLCATMTLTICDIWFLNSHAESFPYSFSFLRAFLIFPHFSYFHLHSDVTMINYGRFPEISEAKWKSVILKIW